MPPAATDLRSCSSLEASSITPFKSANSIAWPIVMSRPGARTALSQTQRPRSCSLPSTRCAVHDETADGCEPVRVDPSSNPVTRRSLESSNNEPDLVDTALATMSRESLIHCLRTARRRGDFYLDRYRKTKEQMLEMALLLQQARRDLAIHRSVSALTRPSFTSDPPSLLPAPPPPPCPPLRAAQTHGGSGTHFHAAPAQNNTSGPRISSDMRKAGWGNMLQELRGNQRFQKLQADARGQAMDKTGRTKTIGSGC